MTNGPFFFARRVQSKSRSASRVWLSCVYLASVGLGLSAVGGCGFAPVYGTGGPSIGPVTIVQIDGRTGYFLRQELDRYAALEKGTAPPRTLKIKLTQTFDSAALSVDGLSGRTLLTLKAEYSLEGASWEEPQTGFVTTTVGYESLDQAFGDVALQADAEERAAKQIADRLWADLRRQARPVR